MLLKGGANERGGAKGGVRGEEVLKEVLMEMGGAKAEGGVGVMCSVRPVSEEERGECFLDQSAVAWLVFIYSMHGSI